MNRGTAKRRNPRMYRDKGGDHVLIDDDDDDDDDDGEADPDGRIERGDRLGAGGRSAAAFPTSGSETATRSTPPSCPGRGRAASRRPSRAPPAAVPPHAMTTTARPPTSRTRLWRGSEGDAGKEARALLRRPPRREKRAGLRSDRDAGFRFPSDGRRGGGDRKHSFGKTTTGAAWPDRSSFELVRDVRSDTIDCEHQQRRARLYFLRGRGRCRAGRAGESHRRPSRVPPTRAALASAGAAGNRRRYEPRGRSSAERTEERHPRDLLEPRPTRRWAGPERRHGTTSWGSGRRTTSPARTSTGLALPGDSGTGGVMDPTKVLAEESGSRDGGGAAPTAVGRGWRWRSRSPEGAVDVHSVGGSKNWTVSLVHNDVRLGCSQPFHFFTLAKHTHAHTPRRLP